MADSKELVIGNGFAISEKTEEAISKLPEAVAKLARAITESENQTRQTAENAAKAIVTDVLAQAKRTAIQVTHMVDSYDMKADGAPFTSWADFAKVAWGKSSSWISNNVRITKAFLETKDKKAKELGKAYNMAQLQEMVKFVGKDFSVDSNLYVHLDNGKITPATPATAIREYLKSIGEKKEREEQKVDIFIAETGDYVYNDYLSAYIASDAIKVNFNPDSKDKDGTAWKGIVVIDKATMKAKAFLYHKHTVHTEELMANNETMAVVMAIRKLPEQFRKDLVASYKDNDTIDFEKLCFYIGFKTSDFD